MKFIEPKIPNLGDSVNIVLKSIESPCSRGIPNAVYKNGEFVPYTEEETFTQSIYVYVILSNGSIFSNRTFNDLPKSKIHLFPNPGYFIMSPDIWKELDRERFYLEMSKGTDIVVTKEL